MSYRDKLSIFRSPGVPFTFLRTGARARQRLGALRRRRHRRRRRRYRRAARAREAQRKGPLYPEQIDDALQHDFVEQDAKDVRGSESNCEQDSRKM